MSENQQKPKTVLPRTPRGMQYGRTARIEIPSRVLYYMNFFITSVASSTAREEVITQFTVCVRSSVSTSVRNVSKLGMSLWQIFRAESMKMSVTSWLLARMPEMKPNRD